MNREKRHIDDALTGKAFIAEISRDGHWTNRPENLYARHPSTVASRVPIALR